jgi:hypothetical protein
MAEKYRPGETSEDSTETNVLDKLDRLIAKHRPHPSATNPEAIPVLREIPPANSTPQDTVPVLTDVVVGSVMPPLNTRTDDVRLILRHLLRLLRSERNRWLKKTEGDPQRAQLIEAVLNDLEAALPNTLAEAVTALTTDEPNRTTETQRHGEGR